MRMEGYTSIAALIEGGVFYRCTTYRYGRETNGLRMSEAKNYAVRQVPRDMSQRLSTQGMRSIPGQAEFPKWNLTWNDMNGILSESKSSKFLI